MSATSWPNLSIYEGTDLAKSTSRVSTNAEGGWEIGWVREGARCEMAVRYDNAYEGLEGVGNGLVLW